MSVSAIGRLLLFLQRGCRCPRRPPRSTSILLLSVLFSR